MRCAAPRARRITAVIPYYGYGRQDRKVGGRTPISAKLVANLIVTAGANRVLTLELHAGQIQGFFDIPTDNLFSTPVLERDIREHCKDVNKLMIVSPDVGGVVRARALANRLGADLAIVDKRREKAGVSEVMHIIGDVEGRDCILIDDIVDSAGTLCNAAEALLKEKAASVSAYVTHGVLSNGAVKRVREIQAQGTGRHQFDRPQGAQSPRATRSAPSRSSQLMGDAIWRIANEESVSSCSSRRRANMDRRRPSRHSARSAEP